MIILVKHDFVDLEHDDTLRKAGQAFEVSEKRGSEIIKKGYAVKLEVTKLEKPEEEPKKKAKTGAKAE